MQELVLFVYEQNRLSYWDRLNDDPLLPEADIVCDSNSGHSVLVCISHVVVLLVMLFVLPTPLDDFTDSIT